MNRSHVPDYVMSTLCRICAEKSSKLTPIFEIESLPSKIYKCLPIEVKESDFLPQKVCEACFLKIDESYTLYEAAFEADQRLKKLWEILIKETMTDYTSSETCDKPETVESDLILIGDTQSSLKLVENKERNMTATNVVINIPEDVMYHSVEVLGDSGNHINGVTNKLMIVGKTISFEVLTPSVEAIPIKHNEKEDQESHVEEPQENDIHESHVKTRDVEDSKVLDSADSEERPYLCDICGKSFKHASNLRCHARTHQSIRKKYICKLCSKAFVTNFFLREHMNTHTGDTPYKCSVCGKEFREKVHLRQHNWTHSNEKFICPICGNEFSRKGNVNEHIKKYHGNNKTIKSKIKTKKILKESKNFKCPACSCEFPDQILLKNHLKVHPEQKRFFCSICGKKFRHSGSLTYHRRTAHTGERPFQCSYCEQKFSLRSVQMIHERKNHTFEHPYKCTFCSRMFTNSSSLRNHLYVHSKEKMFECDECGKKFSRGSNLLVHKKLHTGDRPFTCDQCGKSYIQKHDMLKHKKVHDPKSKPFFCKYCGNSFSHKKDSSKHAMCQFDFLRKNNPDTSSAEKILDSVTNNLERSVREFFVEEQQIILESVEELSGENISGADCIYKDSEALV